MKIGFIGLGEMGRPMAAKLLKAGHELRVWNRSAERTEPLIEQGAKRVDAAKELADAELIVVMLADDTALRSVFGSGLLDALRAPTVVVNTSTISLAYARELAAQVTQRGAGYVSAPVFGRPPVAEAGQLNIVVSGTAADIARAEPALNAMAKKLWPMGDAPERANAVKIAGNFMIASAIETMAEASAFAQAHGIEPRDFLGMMTQTLFAAPVYAGYGAAIAERNFKAGFKAALGYKDVELALSAAGSARVPMPIASVIRDALLDALAHDGAEQDWAVLAEVAQRRAGLPSA